ncbi:MAG: PKD domain-containing protein [Gammaproteobacteria bacterium]|nr:PKD domain-containing protein [Gammaproteobacteria bacterium]
MLLTTNQTLITGLTAITACAFLLVGLSSCGGGGGSSDTAADSNESPKAIANGTYIGTVGIAVQFSSAGSDDPDGSIEAYTWDFGDGTSSNQANPSHTYSSAASYSVTLQVTDNDGATDSDTAIADITDPPPAPATSINSTSRDSLGRNGNLVAEPPIVTNTDYSILAINDLGMHCGDYDTRIASILPPFQVLLAQVIEKGASPVLNPPGISLRYAAASNPEDPILSQADVFTGLKDDGSTYKTNFWDSLLKTAYDPFYPPIVTPLASSTTTDIGLPVPNVEHLYIGPDGQVNSGDESLTAVQLAMPGLTNPYIINAPQPIDEHYDHKPFFIDFPFGYVAEQVNWYEGAGIPFSAFDDFGRENPYPLVRVEALLNQSVVSTIDTVLPISGEASCINCHADPADVQTSRTSEPTDRLINAGLPVATSLDDPDDNLPQTVSVEYASDINVLRLHDLKHGARYVDTANQPVPCDITLNGGNGDSNCLTYKALIQDTPVVCQVCHYTPALDLAQVGPMAGAPGSEANGRNQLAHQSNSRVMHHHHGQYTNLFPSMPAPQQNVSGTITNQAERLTVLEETCYQCHPGSTTECLRGAMFNGGMLCNDCHGDMLQVGADFSAGVSPSNPGAFILGGDFYDPHDPQPRVPWANEPGCGSCHTGDASTNLVGTANTIVNTVDSYGNLDGIRLRQAYLSGDAKATPIVPTNKRFAEPAVAASFNGFANPGAGNPKLYRVSTGHGGVFCEGCHGATHAEWPNANPNANDNVTAKQLQGHSGTLVECSVCHGSAMDQQNTLDGPHGMHPVGGHTDFARGGHETLAELNNGADCRVCHGPGTREDNQGTVLSLAKAERTLQTEDNRSILVSPGTPIGCALCH